MAGRPGWSAMTAVARDRIYEIPSSTILQPGPGCLTDGVRALHARLLEIQALSPPGG